MAIWDNGYHCYDCVFHSGDIETDGGDVIGLCRRYPPSKVILDQDPIDAWPRVNSDCDWCGEFKLNRKSTKTALPTKQG